MNITEIGEFGLIDKITKGTITDPSSVIQGIGDDAAVLKFADKHWQLLTTDMLVENIHFSTKTITPVQLGYRALAINISDIAAMGGIPTNAVISLGLPLKMSVDDVSALYQGLTNCAREFNVNIVGGDTVSSERIVINVALLGQVEPEYCCFRSGARPGDLLAVTGHLGASIAGLKILTEPRKCPSFLSEQVKKKHLEPVPRVKEGRLLAKSGGITALNDISDGLASEINEIASASKVGVILDAERIPVDMATKKVAAIYGDDFLDYALHGGEDFELVMCLKERNHQEIAVRVEKETGTPVKVCGRIVEEEKGVKILENSELFDLKASGYTHF